MSEFPRERVVVTGIGITTPIGQGRQEFEAALLEGKSAFGVMQRPGRQKDSAFLGAELPALRIDPSLTMASGRMVSLSAQAALVTVHEAWHDAKLGEVDPTRIGLIVGGSNFQQREQTLVREAFVNRERFLRPTYALSFMDTDVCGVCTQQFGIRGLAFTVGGACASGQMAVLQAMAAVASGQVDVCIAVGALTDLSYWECQGLRSIGAMGSDRFAERPELACRPFDEQHDGFIFGENCGAVVIERASAMRAGREGVRVYAALSGGAVVMDAHRDPDPSLEGEIKVVRDALAQAGVEAKDIDYVNPHGTGSRVGDDTELRALLANGLGHAHLNATKSLLGHGFTAAGTVELIATLVQMQAGRLHPTRNLEAPIRSEMKWVPAGGVAHEIQNAVSVSLGFGGINTAICVQRVKETRGGGGGGGGGGVVVTSERVERASTAVAVQASVASVEASTASAQSASASVEASAASAQAPAASSATAQASAAAMTTQANASSGWAQVLAAVTPGERLRMARGLIVAEVEELLDEKVTSERTGLKELGLSSGEMVALTRRLSLHLTRRVSETVAFSHPNVEALAKFVLESLGLESGAAAVAVAEVPVAAPSSSAAQAAPVRDGSGADEDDADDDADAQRDPIAIVGLACRAPGGVVDLESLWQLLESERDTVQALPEERRAMFGAGEDWSRLRGSFVERVAELDAAFFGISPHEAKRIDPTYRMLLEVAWEALEHAKIIPAHLEGSDTGMFMGVGPSEYDSVRPRAAAPFEIDVYGGLGTSPSVAVGRISYLLGLQGPALAVDTLCSSSLVAIHLACQSLRAGECGMALAGGASLILSPSTFAWLGNSNALADDGRCKTFSADADGYGRGEGCGVLVLKRLSDARADGDRVWAVIRGSAINHDGAASGLTAPNGKAQESLIERALDVADCSSDQVGYVEAHGTGTPLGDPIEIEAISAVYGRRRSKEQPLLLGSVKTNLGHLEYAAGVLGVLKVVAALQHGRIPAHRHAEILNPRVVWDEVPLAVPRVATAWPEWNAPKRAGVSSFGMSGTNAHVILEEAPAAEGQRDEESRGPWPFLLSAKSEAALRAQAAKLRAYVAAHEELALGDVAYSLATTRSQFDVRAAFSAGDRAGLLRGLEPLASGATPGQRGRGGKLAVLFTGQGSQHLAMGKALYERFDGFRRSFDGIRARLDMVLGAASWLRDVVFAAEGSAEAALLDQTGYAQSCLFALEVSLYRLYESWGVRAEILLGHSIGELAAAHVAGVLSLDDACRLVGARARLMQALPGGGLMLAVQGTEEEVAAALVSVNGGGGVAGGASADIAAINGPASVVVSGDPAAVQEMERRFEAMGRSVTRLRVSHAFHSHHMSAMLESFAAVARTVTYRSPTIPVVSNLTGKLAQGHELCSAEYWVEHVRRAVRFRDGVRTLHAEGARTFLELGPRGVLTALAQEALTEEERAGTAFVAGLRRAGADLQATTAALSALHVRGHAVEWERYLPGRRSTTVPLPTYAFQRERYWIEAAQGEAGRGETGTVRVERVERAAMKGASAAAGVQASATSGAATSAAYAASGSNATRGASMNGVGATSTAYAASGSNATRDANVTSALIGREWRKAALPAGVAANGRGERWVMLAAELSGARTVAAKLSSAHCEQLAAGESVSGAIEQVFVRVQEILKARPAQPVLVQVVLASPAPAGLAPALAGLLRTASLENPLLVGQVIAVPGAIDAAALGRALDENTQAQADVEIRYVDGGREVRGFEELSAAKPAGKQSPLWRDGGVYWITGGAGGLGQILARDMISRAAGLTLILTGRSPLGAAQRSAIEGLQALGESATRVEYHALDVSDAEAVSRMVASIIQAHGRLDGVVHAAGVIQDRFLLMKTREELRAVLGAKVQGTLNLDRATAHLRLELFLLFSSTSGVFGNVGQADYAAANGFLDGYAEHREQLVQRGQRSGRTLAIAWPLWASGGMQVDDATAAELRQRGLHALPAQAGLEMLDRAWASGRAHVAVLHGERRGLAPWLVATTTTTTATTTTSAAVPAQRGDMAVLSEALRERVLHRLKAALAEVSGMEIAGIEAKEPLRRYGIDSIMITRLNGKLGAAFAGLSKTLFFEYPTLQQVSEHLLAAHGEACARWVGVEAAAPVQAQPQAPQSAPLQPRGERGPVEPHHPTPRGAREGIAIIGLAGTYPGARDVGELWKNLEAGRNCVGEIPADRWSLDGFFEADMERAIEEGKSYSRWGGFVEGFAEFDPRFFGISPREAASIDPQERLFLQASWEALEDAGYTRESLAQKYQGRVGVYTGVTKTGFEKYSGVVGQNGEKIFPRTSFSSMANRVSYLLDLHGPSMPIDTMCSASLTAIHEACEHLYRGECELAIAGGVNLYLHPESYVYLSAQRMLSKDGACKSFGAGGNGFVPGEGAGAVVLKPLAAAIADGDHIYGVVRATSVNHGGRTHGYTVPNPAAQRDLVLAALRQGQIDPRAISYFEAHGTGTELGDPVEMTGLTQAFARHTQDVQFCAIGSVKTNMGHLEGAAGIAGLTKVLLQMQHGKLAPSLHAKVTNPLIDFARTPFKVQQTLEEWTRPRGGSRLAAISSFGAGGANAHAIVEEYVDARGAGSFVSASRPALLVLSARSAERLQEYARRLLAHLSGGAVSEASLGDIAYTLQVGREAMEHRLGFTARTLEEARQKLAGYLEGKAGRGELEELYEGTIGKHKELLSMFAADDDLQTAIEAWMDKGKHARVLELWAKGMSFDWSRCYQREASQPRRVSLPAYPFARERYWIAGEAVKAAPVRVAQAVEAPRVVQAAPVVERVVEVAAAGEVVIDELEPAVVGIALRQPVAFAVDPFEVEEDEQPRRVELRPLHAVVADAAEPVAAVAAVVVALEPVAATVREPVVISEPVMDRDVEGELSKSLAEALYMEVGDIDANRAFVEMGLDSIIGVEWTRKINKQYGITLLATKLYAYPTINTLAVLLREMLPRQVATVAAPASAAVAGQEVPVVAVAPSAPVAHVAPIVVGKSAQELEGELCSSLAEALYMEADDVDLERPFVEMGLDSIIGVEWTRKINKRYGISLAATKLYEYPTVRALAGLLAKQVPAAAVAPVAAKSVTGTVPLGGHRPAAAAAAPVATKSASGTVPLGGHRPVAAAPVATKSASGTVPLGGHRPAAAAPVVEKITVVEKAPAASTKKRPELSHEPIAIVGMSGRYPGAADLSTYWQNLAAGKNSVERIPSSRWNVDDYYDPEPGKPGKIYCNWLGRLDGVEHFDPLFFNISPAEAQTMDPQHRLFLEEAYKAFQDAGYSAQRLNYRKCGVYLGVMTGDYGVLLQQAGQGLGDNTGNSAAIGAARIAYHLNLKGPAIPVDTACSGSLVATHLACQALRTGEVEMALVGGVTLYLAPQSYIAMCTAGMLSPDGQCKTFDNGADGFVPGEGVGALVLKRLGDAEADGDRIYGVIVASGINQDGKTNGITAPSLMSQMELVRDVYARYDIHPESISYVEMHGTGTKLGDPIELEALATAYRERTQRTGFCAIGSVKSNIGHTSAAAGMAGVHKVLLSMQHDELPATLNFRTPNEHFDFASSPFRVNSEKRAWRGDGAARRAAVSSFGFSGTNAHVVIEEYRTAPRAPSPGDGTRSGSVVVLSARNEARLQEAAGRLRAHVERAVHSAADLVDLAYTLQLGRDAMDHRLAMVVGSKQDLLAALSDFLDVGEADGVYVGQVKKARNGRLLVEGVEDVSGQLGQWIAGRESKKVAQAWVRGFGVDWAAWYGQERRKIVSAPGYAFARESFWVEAAVSGGRTVATIEPVVAAAPSAPSASAAKSKIGYDPAALEAQVQAALVEAIARQLKMRAAEIGKDTELGEFGLDSIRLMAFAAHLNRTYGLDVSPAVFFEHRTVRELGKYLVERYSGVLGPQLGGTAQAPATATAPAPVIITRVEAPSAEPIAIIGMSGRFPGARDVDAFWDNLAAGRDSISEIPASRWDWRALYGDPNKENGKTNVKWGGFLDGIEEFDALFFGISPREAQYMDPQQRLLMLEAWKAIEDAGYAPASLSGTRTGVFVGTLASGGYSDLIAQSNLPIEGYTATGTTASIGPNRVSFLLNLHGPSEPIETACSSSLVAMHRAIRAMHNGEIDLALVGGVNTIASPTGHISCSRAGMLSVEGRCKTFSKSASGYARGEGAAILMLKRLSAAERDGDRIYGVIRGSAENHGGRASTLTAPNPKAQAELIKEAHQRAGIDPRTVTYIEAHGTGTPLGDPVEVNGLKSAFAELYAAHPSSEIAADEREVGVGLGSVKTNIGHLEIAAGVAGVIKVLLQFQHQTLVKTLHCEELNPFIQLDGSPFHIVQEARPWPALRGRDGGELPRRAGVSSFGFGGVNAHVILEEYRPQRAAGGRSAATRTATSLEQPVLLVLSARNADRLRAQARQLLTYLGRGGLRDGDLVDLAYTLQVGRDAMAHRAAFAARSLEHARTLLQVVAEGDSTAQIYRGEAKKNREAAGAFELSEIDAGIEAWRALGDAGALLSQWAGGRDVDWHRLYGGVDGTVAASKPRRLRLPVYPFAAERCWVDASDGVKASGRAASVEQLHPLLQRNTSTLSEARFSTTFDGTERFLTDHVVDGGKVLPGVAYLEMARAAVERAAPDREGCLVLSDVVWMQPIVVRERCEVHVALAGEAGDEAGAVEVRVYSGPQVVHAQAKASWVAAAAAQVVNLTALKARCERTLDAAECYAAYRAMKIEYGPAHRGLTSVQLGRDEAGQRFLLAQVALPSVVRDSAADYVLHPSVMDAAFQSTIGLLLDAAGGSPMLPYAVERLQILDGTAAAAWVYVRPSEAPAGAGAQKLDLDVLDGSGRVCVRVRGLTARAMNQRAVASSAAAMTTAATRVAPSVARPGEDEVMLVPHWEPRPLAAVEAWPGASSKVVLISGSSVEQRAWRQHYPALEVVVPSVMASEGELADRLQRLGSLDHLIWIAPASDAADRVDARLIDAQATGVIALYRLIKALLSLGYGARALGLTVVTTQTQAVVPKEDVAPAHASVHGLVGSLAKEQGGWKVRLIEQAAVAPAPLDELLTVPADAKGDAWAYRAGEWFRQELVPCQLAAAERPAFRQRGVYVVVGGAGGIGEVLSEYLMRRYQAQLVWIGRRPLDAEIQGKLDRLSTLGAAPLYISADATDGGAMEAAHRQIKARHGQVTGVIHAAIQLLDRSLAQMDEARFRAALAAKVDVGVHLAEVFGRDPLELVLFFSSMQSFAKAAGQSNYAAGCAFKDALAQRLGRELPGVLKVMNWSYWGSVGIVASESYRSRMAKVGVGSIEPDEAMAALERLIAGPRAQMILLKTTSPELLPQIGAVEDQLTQLAGAARLTLDHVPLRKDRPAAVARWHEGMADMQELLARLLLGQMQAMGLSSADEVADEASIAAWRQRVGMRPGYGRWMQETLRVLNSRGLALETRVSIEALWSEWETRRVAWLEDPSLRAQAKLVEAAVRALPEVLTGKRLSTDVLFPGSSMELVEGVYKHNVAADYFNSVLADSVEALLQKRIAQGDDARIRVLEIGAGTGGTSEGVLRRLNLYGGAIVEYCFTDLSKAFLLHAQKEYAPSSPYLVTRIFNVEQPLHGQGVDLGGYDLVIGANVLHATKNIRQTLRNAKAALKPGGALVLNELSGNTLAMHLTFGLLEGWWRYEDPALRVVGAPLLAPETWARMLRSEGFGGVKMPAELAHEYGQAIIVAESDGVIRQAKAAAVVAPVGVAVAAAAAPVAAAPVAAVGGSDRDRMMAVRQIIREAIGRALKIDHEGIQDEVSFSEYGVDSIVGVSLIKEINESFGINLPTTSLFDYPTLKSLTKHVSADPGTAVKLAPVAAAPVAAAAAAPIAVATPVFAPAPTPAPAPALARPMPAPVLVEPIAEGQAAYHRVLVRGPGLVDDLEVAQAAVPRVGEHEVQIAVHAFSLNFGDLLCVKGLYPTMPAYPYTPGFEVSGTVVDVGASVRTVKRGQRVLALMGAELGGHATVATCHESQVTAIPAGLSFEHACALPVVAITMIDAFHKAAIKPGEKILIQTATGGTGLIAVQLAKHYGAEIYATAGSARKVEYLQQQLGVAHAINYVAQDFEQEIRRLTNGAGVDVVINTLSGDAIQKGLNCLASGGRYIEIAMTALKSARAIDLSVLSDNQTFYSVDLSRMARSRPEKLAEYRREMLALAERGVISATLSDVVPFDEIRRAYRQLENRENIGKVVVAIPAERRYKRVAPTSATGATGGKPSPGVREPIAIIGMSGRFATAENAAELWQGLAGGVELTQKVTRWDLREHLTAALGPDDNYCDRGGLLRQIDQFDAEHFNISGLEATYMDPHQRLFLEEGWKALEDAGYMGEGLSAARCGVYVGCAGGDYLSLFGGDEPAQAFWGNSGSVISARISYHLNLQGPAITVDTACSSSLVAMHLACQALWSGEIEIGLAGGVHVQCTPSFYVMASRAAMLSPEGRCHAFDARANGFVPGEGAGAVVLKRLSDAQRDGDHVYGVIRGSGINQDGATNGITAPSALSQESLEREVYDTFQIDPAHIQLMEAHGTGTKLGDPIEWRALVSAFRQFTEEQRFCAIGSIKTNLGHTAAAAGVAGVFKILLALKHRQLPPSLHFEHGNPHIDFENSPFFVNTQLRPWPAVDGRPRTAAVSSFGFGGTNAHLVIEEAPATDRVHEARPGYLIALSAKSAARLRAQVEALLGHCEAEPELELGDVSFTLMMGRKHFDHRLACVVRDARELQARLREWRDSGAAQGVFTGKLSGPGGAEVLLEQRGAQCLEACRGGAPAGEYLECLRVIGELYTQGYGLAYEQLFAGDGYSRLSLPATRLVAERHWVDVAAPRPLVAAASLHPLVQRNTSDLRALRFSSTLSGQEAYLTDHRVAGSKVLPGVCYLEMARAAVERSAGGEPTGVILRDVLWMQPLAVVGATDVHIGLRSDGDGDNAEIEFEISSAAGVHAQGRALLAAAAAEQIDLAALRAGAARTLDVARCYAAFAAMGIEYGPAHRVLTSVQVGEGFVLARVSLPAGTSDAFVLHPSVLDGALQATIALTLGDDDDDADRDGAAPREPLLPFALERLEIAQRSPSPAWVVVRLLGGRYQIAICDEAGQVCVRLDGLSAKAKTRTAATTASVSATATTTSALASPGAPMMMVPRWEATELPEHASWPSPHAKVALVGGTRAQQQLWRQRFPQLQLLDRDVSVDDLAARGDLDHLVWLAPESRSSGDEAMIAAQDDGVVGLYRLLKALLVLGYDARRFELTVVTWRCQATVPSERADATHAAVHGLVGSLAKEYDDWKIRLVDGEELEPCFLERLLRVPADANGDAWVHREGEWYRQRLIACDLGGSSEIPYRRGGVYVVIGGAGGIGEVFSEHVIRQHGAHVVWLGRSARSAAIDAKLARLAKLGPAPRYLQCDAADRASLERAYQQIKAEHGAIHGVVHAAIVLLDKSLAQMDEERFRASLAAKVDVSVRLAQVFAGEPLDFVAFFSSLQSFSKAAGQSNYAAGCTFKDAFASQLARQWPCAVKVMNWGWWGSVGIVASESYRQRMQQAGFGSIEPVEGMAALEQLLASPVSQLVLVKSLADRAEQL